MIKVKANKHHKKPQILHGERHFPRKTPSPLDSGAEQWKLGLLDVHALWSLGLAAVTRQAWLSTVAVPRCASVRLLFRYLYCKTCILYIFSLGWTLNGSRCVSCRQEWLLHTSSIGWASLAPNTWWSRSGPRGPGLVRRNENNTKILKSGWSKVKKASDHICFKFGFNLKGFELWTLWFPMGILGHPNES